MARPTKAKLRRGPSTNANRAAAGKPPIAPVSASGQLPPRPVVGGIPLVNPAADAALAAAAEKFRANTAGAKANALPWWQKAGNWVEDNPSKTKKMAGILAGSGALAGGILGYKNSLNQPSPLMPSGGTMPSAGTPSRSGTQQGGTQQGTGQGGAGNGVLFNKQGPSSGIAGAVASGNDYMYSNRDANGWIGGKNDFNGMSDIAKGQAAYMNARGLPTAAQSDNYINQSLTDKNSAGYDAMNSALARMNGQVYQKPQPSAPVPAAPTASQPTMASPAGPASPDIMMTIRGAVNSTFPQNTAANVAANTTGPAPAAAPSYQKANQGAIDALKADPSDEKIAQFNAIHGPNAHTEWLSE